MGVVIAQRADSFRSRDALVAISGYCAGTLSAAAFVALVSALAALGWQDFRWALTAPEGPKNALLTSLFAVGTALPVTCAAGFFAAACTTDPAIGDRTNRLLRLSFEWSAGVPPVVVGVAVFFAATAFSRAASAPLVVAALIALNLPNAASRFARAFSAVSEEERAAAAAAGASPVRTFFGIVAPRAGWPLAAVLFSLAAQMTGETSAVVAANVGTAVQPLSARTWQFASNISLATSEAASCILLVLIVSAFAALSKACSSKVREPDETQT